VAAPRRGFAFPGDVEEEEGEVEEEDQVLEGEKGAEAEPEPVEPEKGWKPQMPVLQPENQSPIGCIYPKSMTPGPGHYKLQNLWPGGGLVFTRKPRGRIDELMRRTANDPAPGQYEPPKTLTLGAFVGPGKDKVRGVKFSEVKRLRLPVEGPNCAPLITVEHAKNDNIGIFSPGYFHDVLPSEREEQVVSKYRHQPTHTIGKARRL